MLWHRLAGWLAGGLVVMGLGLLVLPVALHLLFGADNDAALLLVDGGGQRPTTLAYLSLEWLYRPATLLWAGTAMMGGGLLWWLRRLWAR